MHCKKILSLREKALKRDRSSQSEGVVREAPVGMHTFKILLLLVLFTATLTKSMVCHLLLSSSSSHVALQMGELEMISPLDTPSEIPPPTPTTTVPKRSRRRRPVNANEQPQLTNSAASPNRFGLSTGFGVNIPDQGVIGVSQGGGFNPAVRTLLYSPSNFVLLCRPAPSTSVAMYRHRGSASTYGRRLKFHRLRISSARTKTRSD